MRTEAAIAAFQEQSGIKPATGEHAELLEEIPQTAFALIKIVELQRSGICDGDGYWHGSDPLRGCIVDLSKFSQRLDELWATEAA